MASDPGPSRPVLPEVGSTAGLTAEPPSAPGAGTPPPGVHARLPRPPVDRAALVEEARTALRVEHWDGGSRTITGLEALAHSVRESAGRHWVDLTDPSPSLVDVVADELGLHPLVAEDIVERNQRPKLELTGEHVHLVVFGVRYEREHEVEVEEVDVVLGGNFLLTVHSSAWDLSAAHQLRGGVGPLLAEGADFVCWALLDGLVDSYFPVFDRIEDEIDQLEDLIIDRPGRDTLERLFAMKRSLIEIRHVMAPQREMFNQLTNRTLPYIAPDHVVYFRDIYDHAVHLAEEYDSFRELVSGALDVYLSTINNNLSLTMKRLTGITAVLAGIGAFAGIFGMSEAGAAFAGAEAIGFWLVSGEIIVLSLALLVLLRRLDWI